MSDNVPQLLGFPVKIVDHATPALNGSDIQFVPFTKEMAERIAKSGVLESDAVPDDGEPQ